MPTNSLQAEPLLAADQKAVAKAMRAEPVWLGMTTAQAAFGLKSNTLLHAGPPFEDTKQVPAPIMNSACVSAVFEGIASDFDVAQSMITSGEIELKAAQDYSVVTPLAAVVSASMPLHRVDGNGGNGSVYAPINGGSRPSLRLGLRSDAVLNHIRWLNTTFAQLLEDSFTSNTNKLNDAGIPLVPIAVQGLHGGDDCHGRTVVANKWMMDAVLEQNVRKQLDVDTLDFIESSPSLFLNVWMAASKFIMKSAEGITDSSFITAVAGNGVNVGIQVSGLSGRWFVASATAPVGSFDVDVPPSRAIGAIGDSAVVEGLGLGAMAVRHAPEQLKQFKDYLPANMDSRVNQLLCGEHDAFGSLNQKLGLCARTVVSLGSTPVVALGIIDKLGEKGRLGGGIYEMPDEPFAKAIEALNVAAT